MAYMRAKGTPFRLRVLVAGAGGYLGGRLVAELAGRPGVEVTGLVRSRRPWLGCEQVVADLARDDLARDDLARDDPARDDLARDDPARDDPARDDLAGALDGIGTVVHLAGLSETVAAAEPERAVAETIAVTQRLAAAARAAGVRRIVYLSTVHVYGARTEAGTRLTEDLRPEPRQPYAIARLASEHVLAAEAARSAGHLDVVTLRLTNAVGAPADPGVDRWTLVANDLARQAVSTGRMTLRTPGDQHRDFVALSDAVRITAECCAADGGGARVPPGTYNLGSGRALRVRDLAGLVGDAVESATGDRPVLDAPAAGGAVPAPVVVAVDRLAGLGLAASRPIEEAVAETVRFCLDHRGRLGAGAGATGGS